MAMMLTFTVSASAHRNCGEDWKEKMICEKIAFLTGELGITPEEAQVFWPVYNEVNKEKDKAMQKVFKTFKAMNDALEEGKTGKEIEALLEKHLEALEEQRELDDKVAERYMKVLPVEKVAKLYVGEEKFRRQHIRKMKAASGHPKPDRKPQPVN